MALAGKGRELHVVIANTAAIPIFDKDCFQEGSGLQSTCGFVASFVTWRADGSRSADALGVEEEKASADTRMENQRSKDFIYLKNLSIQRSKPEQDYREMIARW